jgi:DNA-binding IclR family transcriptional regulator
MNELFGALKPLALLEAVAGMQHPASLAELAVHVGVPKATMHRWLGSLEDAGLIQRTPDGRRYELATTAHCGNTDTASPANTAACNPAMLSETERIDHCIPAAPSASSA